MRNIPDELPLNKLKVGDLRALLNEYKQSDSISRDALPVEVDGVFYYPNDWVEREIAVKISTLNNSYFSTVANAGKIDARGRGQQTRYYVADCLKYNKGYQSLSRHAA